MRETPADEAARWFRQSELDLEDARFASAGERHHLACFLSQQAAEKALKAFLYASGAEAVWKHSVADLCRDASEFDRDFRSLTREAAPLDKYYIPTRYPNGLPGGIPSEAFSLDDANMAIAMSAKVIDFVREKLTL